MCLPPTHEASPYYQGSWAPQLSWKDRWGAIASNSSSGVIGTASGRPTKEMAEEQALLQCEIVSAKDCVLEISYFNQCAAMITGENTYATARAETKALAIDLGMKICVKENSNCEVYYSDCSFPVLTK